MQGTGAVLTRITFEGTYLRAEISDRQTARETREFLEAVVVAAETRQCGRVLISVKDSNPLFRVENYGISAYFKALAANPAYKVALLGDSEEIRASHEYIVLLAGQIGARVSSFRSESEAVQWLSRD